MFVLFTQAPAGCPNVGWNCLLDTGPLSNRTHRLDVTVTAADGRHGSENAMFEVVN